MLFQPSLFVNQIVKSVEVRKVFTKEKNINDKTGKPRTFTEFDLYPRQPGETSRQYGDRLKFMHQKIAEYEAAEQAKAEAETRAMVAAGSGETKETVNDEVKNVMTLTEIRNSAEYIDAFANYEERGEKFVEVIQSLQAENREKEEHLPDEEDPSSMEGT